MMKLKLLITQHPKEGANPINCMKMIKSPCLGMISSYRGEKREDTKQGNFPTISVQILTTMATTSTDKERNHPLQIHLLNTISINQKEIITTRKKIVSLYNTLSNS